MELIVGVILVMGSWVVWFALFSQSDKKYIDVLKERNQIEELKLHYQEQYFKLQNKKHNERILRDQIRNHRPMPPMPKEVWEEL